MSVCERCGTSLVKRKEETVKQFANRRFCSRKCVRLNTDKISSMSKGELFSSRKNWQSARSSIRKNAERVLTRTGIEHKCSVCGYSNYVEVCHIKSVSEFPDSAKICDINDKKNLVYLCPNHHWEFDHSLLEFQKIIQRVVGKVV